MNWRSVYFGNVKSSEVLDAVKDEDWQIVRRSMKGMTLEQKYKTLQSWLRRKNRSTRAKIQVTNYVTALSRGGLIKPSDYRD